MTMNMLMTVMRDSDDTTVIGQECPGHRVLTDVVKDLYDCSSTSTLEAAVRPKCNLDADELIDNLIENEAVRPMSDMDAEGAAAAKKIPEDNDEASNKNVKIRRLIEERRNTPKGEKQHLKEVSKQTRTCIRDKKRSRRQKNNNKSLRNAEVSRTYPTSNQRGRECLFQMFKTTKARQSHREMGLQMSSVNSTANFVKAMKLKRSFKIL